MNSSRTSLAGLAVLLASCTPTPSASTAPTHPASAAPTPTATAPMTLTSSPFDLSQISSISKFRSCAGHDYSGQDVNGVLESGTSMKHYLQPTAALSGTTQAIKLLAPFDGSVRSVFHDFENRGSQYYLTDSTGSGWDFVFFHVDPLPGMVQGSTLKSGDLIGYADVAGASDFDVAFQKQLQAFSFDASPGESFSSSPSSGLPDGGRNFVLDSMFNHLSPAVAQYFAAHGVTVDNAIPSPDDRRSKPCNFGAQAYADPGNWVAVKAV